MRSKWDWENDMKAVYNHTVIRDPGMDLSELKIRVSPELEMEIQSSFTKWSVAVDFITGDTLWRGIPVRRDLSLPPMCFIFEKGEI